MKAPQLINAQLELNHLVEYIRNAWDGTEQVGNFEAFISEAFHKGLQDGKLWVDEHLTFRIGELLNNGELILPLKAHKTSIEKIDTLAPYHDALSIFDSWVSDSLREIHRAKTGYGNWNFSKNADSLLNTLKGKYYLEALKPKAMTREAEKALITSFKGAEAMEAGSIATTEKLSPSQANYWNDEQAIVYMRSLTGAVYSHGLFCSKTNNTNSLIGTLLPIYVEGIKAGFSIDSGSTIIEQASENAFIKLMLNMSVPEFSSQDKLDKEIAEAKANRARIAQETAEEREKRLAENEAYMNALMDEIMNEDDGESEKEVEFKAKLAKLETDYQPVTE